MLSLIAPWFFAEQLSGASDAMFAKQQCLKVQIGILVAQQDTLKSKNLKHFSHNLLQMLVCKE